MYEPGRERSTTVTNNELQEVLQQLRQKDLIIEQQKERIFELEEELERYFKVNSGLGKTTLTRFQADEEGRGGKDSDGPASKKAKTRYWTAEEHSRFLEAVKK